MHQSNAPAQPLTHEQIVAVLDDHRRTVRALDALRVYEIVLCDGAMNLFALRRRLTPAVGDLRFGRGLIAAQQSGLIEIEDHPLLILLQVGWLDELQELRIAARLTEVG